VRFWRGEEANTIFIAPSHFIRTETAFDKERKEKKSESLLQQEEPGLTLAEL